MITAIALLMNSPMMAGVCGSDDSIPVIFVPATDGATADSLAERLTRAKVDFMISLVRSSSTFLVLRPDVGRALKEYVFAESLGETGRSKLIFTAPVLSVCAKEWTANRRSAPSSWKPANAAVLEAGLGRQATRSVWRMTNLVSEASMYLDLLVKRDESAFRIFCDNALLGQKRFKANIAAGALSEATGPNPLETADGPERLKAPKSLVDSAVSFATSLACQKSLSMVFFSGKGKRSYGQTRVLGKAITLVILEKPGGTSNKRTICEIAFEPGASLPIGYRLKFKSGKQEEEFFAWRTDAEAGDVEVSKFIGKD